MTFDIIGVILAVIGAMLIVALYIRNMWKVVLSFRTADYNLLLVSRIIGIFVPVWGIVMGFV